ncbi:MAG: AGE family epimerase/isomerase [Prolixibacteraceae bacterium]|nr:AGE family epimerase/isomerase [Prolixibacteraceae bacterium]
MKQIKILLISVIVTFSMCNYIFAQGGATFETAVEATFDTSNVADAGMFMQYFYFTPDFNGFVDIGNCGLTDLVTEVDVFDEMQNRVMGNNYFCDFQMHTVIPVDSSNRYVICWNLFGNQVDQHFNWYLNEYQPEPGEFIQMAIPVEVGDTIELTSVNNSTETWYKLVAGKHKMITASNCGFGNGKHDINSISVYKETVRMYIPDWIRWTSNCSDGLFVAFPTDSGSIYYIQLYHRSDLIDVKWTLCERDIMPGESCDSAILVDKNEQYTVPSEKNSYWYRYTPAQNEYKVIGSIQGKEQYAGLYIKEECDCEPDYSGTPGCIEAAQNGVALLLEAGKTYHIGWKNWEYIDIFWSIYDPVDIFCFTVDDQVEPTKIDHENHTIDITVGPRTPLTDLCPFFINANGVNYIVDGEIQSFNSKQDFTNPVSYTVSYTDEVNNVTLSQDWLVTVTKEESSSGPYTVKSSYLTNPDLAKHLVSDWADFWKGAYDPEHGGFFSYVDREGNPTDGAKTLISQTQNAYAFARAFMVTGDTSYLNHASRALKFMYDHYWDETYGGWYVIVDANGDLSDAYDNTYKYSFFQHYANIGMVAMADATGGVRFKNQDISGNEFNERMHWEMLINSVDVINENLWDDREDYYGYFYEADIDWGNPHGKGFTPTVDGITLHALYMYLLTRDPFFQNRLEQLTNNIEEHMILIMETTKVGFYENYDSNWNGPSGSFYIGHMFKTAWCLAREYLVNPQERYREASKVLMFNLLDNGAYDYVYGAPYSSFDCDNGYVDTEYKLFWEAEQAFTSAMLNYYISNNGEDKERFIEVADGTLEFFMEHFVDEIYGEVFEMTDREGDPNMVKGHHDKAGYHSTELAYYIYLYGNLFYKSEPVELYYFIGADDDAQVVSLYPLAIEDNCLKIDTVELNGNAFTNFDKDSRTLNIGPNEGGVFKVTFSNAKSVSGINDPHTSDNLDVRVFPNPVTSSAIIEYSIDKCTDVTIYVTDITGKVVYSIKNKNVAPGKYQKTICRESFNGNNLCFLQIITKEQIKSVKLIVMD